MMSFDFHPDMLQILPTLGVQVGVCSAECPLTHIRIFGGWLFWSADFVFSI